MTGRKGEDGNVMIARLAETVPMSIIIGAITVYGNYLVMDERLSMLEKSQQLEHQAVKEVEDELQEHRLAGGHLATETKLELLEARQISMETSVDQSFHRVLNKLDEIKEKQN